MGEQIFINQMTTEELKQKLRDNLAAVEASEKGEPWEIEYDGKWRLATAGTNVIDVLKYYYCRPCAKPGPKYWSEPEHVLLNCWMRRKDSPRYSYLVTEIGPVGVMVGRAVRPWTDLYEYEYSTDRINWKPCTVPAPTKPKPHNPGRLTPEQYGASEGYRLLDEDEILPANKRYDSVMELEGSSDIKTGWTHWSIGNSPSWTYRTKLSREELAQKRRDGV